MRLMVLKLFFFKEKLSYFNEFNMVLKAVCIYSHRFVERQKLLKIQIEILFIRNMLTVARSQN